MGPRPGLIPNRTDNIVMATANPNIEHSISHNIGIYVWGFYQVNYLRNTWGTLAEGDEQQDRSSQ